MSAQDFEVLLCVVVWIGVAFIVTLFFYITARWQHRIDKRRLTKKQFYQPLYKRI